MKKILVLSLVALMSCSERGCTDTQKLNGNKRPYTIVSKSAPHSGTSGSACGCYIRLRGSDGNMFELDDCDMCRIYEVVDTIR